MKQEVARNSIRIETEPYKGHDNPATLLIKQIKLAARVVFSKFSPIHGKRGKKRNFHKTGIWQKDCKKALVSAFSQTVRIPALVSLSSNFEFINSTALSKYIIKKGDKNLMGNCERASSAAPLNQLAIPVGAFSDPQADLQFSRLFLQFTERFRNAAFYSF